MRVDFKVSRTPKELENNLHPLDTCVDEFLAHFNHSNHNFGAVVTKISKDYDQFGYAKISAGGPFPFVVDLGFQRTSEVINRSEILRNGFFDYLLCRDGLPDYSRAVYGPPSWEFSGNIYFQCDNSDPRELLDILRCIGCDASVYRAPSPSPSSSSSCWHMTPAISPFAP